MKPFTITVQPCACPVTLTIHGDGEITANPVQSVCMAAKDRPVLLADRLMQRVTQILTESGGYLQATEFHARLQKKSEVYAAIVGSDAVQKFFVDKRNDRRPAVFYVLPSSVEEFKEFIQSRGWKILG